MYVQIGDKDKFRIAQEAFHAQSRAESMVNFNWYIADRVLTLCLDTGGELVAFDHTFNEAASTFIGRSTDSP